MKTAEARKNLLAVVFPGIFIIFIMFDTLQRTNIHINKRVIT